MDEHQRDLLAAQGYCELKMPEDALLTLEALPEAVRREPVAVEIRLAALMQSHRWEEALEQARELCRLCPDAGAGFLQGAFCLHELGRTVEARHLLQHAPASIRGEANYHYNLACYECVLGNLEVARQHLATSIGLDAEYREHAKSDPDLRALRSA